MEDFEQATAFAAFEAPIAEETETAEKSAETEEAEAGEGKYSRSEELRAEAEEIVDNPGINYPEANRVATDPDCPIDATIDILVNAYTYCCHTENVDFYIGPIFARLQAIVSSSDTSMDVMEYIAFSEQLQHLTYAYRKGPIKDIQQTANKVLKDAKVVPQYKIQIEASERKHKKEMEQNNKRLEEELKIIKERANSENPRLRLNAATRKNCPADLLVELATGDPEEYVRVAATENTETPEALRKIAGIAINERDYKVLEALAKNPSCPPDLIMKHLDAIQENWEHAYGNVDWEDVTEIRQVVGAVISEIKEDPDMPLEAMEELRIKYRDARSPLNDISKAAKKKLFSIRLGRAIGMAFPNPKRFPTEAELSEAEVLEKKQAELEEKRQAELQKQHERDAMVVEMLDALKRASDLADKIEAGDYGEANGTLSVKRVALPEKELIIEVGDHHEINPKYLPYISLIDFSLVSTKGLKVSGIDWTKSNIHINPQEVYGRDLSGAKFDDEAIIFGSFKGCNLSGTDISREIESYGLDQAITDDQTKLPRRR